MATKRDHIAETIRARIVAGHNPDKHIASVAGLCDEFDVATGTAVAAMRLLIDAGYVYSDQSGYYIAKSLPATTGDEQRAVVTALRDEAVRLGRIADRLERTILVKSHD